MCEGRCVRVDVCMCLLQKVVTICLLSFDLAIQKDNQYHPYPLNQVKHISYQLLKAVKCECGGREKHCKVSLCV